MLRPLRRVTMGAKNALELVRLGQLSPRSDTPYEIVHRTAHYRLRRYGGATHGRSAPLLLVPPLMLTAEIYDVAADLSAVHLLLGRGIDVWVADFGAPEHEAGGMQRTLDDHVRSVVDAVAKVREVVGQDVHLAGYSQGGMFCYQAAAYLRSEGIASIVTFGSPVNIHKNMPSISAAVAARMIRALRPVVEPPLRMLDGLPGAFTSTAFKMFSFRREVHHLVEFLSLLHDRRELEKREHRRRFLAGEGFVAWPGPSLMKFIDDFVVHNRLLSGGFVIDGRAIALADIRCPVLYFLGTRDEIARPASVRAVREAVPAAEIFEVPLPAGHFGLVVGSVAMQSSWPTVAEWIEWRSGAPARPRLIAARPQGTKPLEIEDADIDVDLDLDLFYDVVRRTLGQTAKWLGDRAEDLGDRTDQARYQLPRLLRLRQLEDETEISVGRDFERRAARHGDRTFFLYEGRAVTYAEGNQRIDNIVRGLISCSVRPGSYVGVLMRPRPTFLSLAVALNRLGAVCVVIKPTDDADALRRSLGFGRVQHLIADPDHATVARRAFDGRVLVLGSGRTAPLAAGVVDMESIDPSRIELPSWYRPNPGRAEDLAVVFVTVGTESSRAVHVTNRRWAISAFGAAAACTLTPNDTVYCCLPLHHPTGLLVSAGAAVAGGCRLALASRFEPDVFWQETRRYGATVAFYAGDLCRSLVDAEVRPGERVHPLRLFAGSGMRKDVWQRLRERFGVGVLEFYASTRANLVLANASGEKIGSVGRPLPGSREAFLAAYDPAASDLVRDERGRLVAVPPGEPGVLLIRVDPMARAPLDEAPPEPTDTHAPTVVRDARAGDAWLVTFDLLKQDPDGDYWFVDSLADAVRTKTGLVASRSVEDLLYESHEVRLCAAYGIEFRGAEVPAAAVVLRDPKGRSRDAVLSRLAREESGLLPRVLRFVDHIALTDGYRPVKAPLRREGAPADGRTYEYDADKRAYGLVRGG